MRGGCCQHNSINRRSLITGNVSTDESRKEIRKRPGAPSVPANATIFCFQDCKLTLRTRPPDKWTNAIQESRNKLGTSLPEVGHPVRAPFRWLAGSRRRQSAAPRG